MPAGRPTEYRQEFAEQAASLAINGATDDEIADDIGVSVRTVMRWYNKHPEFRQAVRYGKEQADEKVERSLYHRAVGFEMDTVKIGFFEGRPVYAEHREYYPPDPGSAKLWLTNRKREDWQERISQEHTGKDGGAIQIVSTIPRPPKDE